MPELPEVETVARTLRPALQGRRVESVTVLWPGSARGGADRLRALAPGREVLAVRRRAKLLLVDLDPPLVLAFHLKMTGRLRVLPDPVAPGPHARLLFGLDNGRSLVFDDARKFGYCLALTPAELEAWDFYAALGPEPLEAGAEEFAARLAGRRARIKALLLDQRVVAGIGNIYADEALHRAGVRPESRASELSAARLKRLHGAVQEVLREAVDACGSSIRDYLDADGNAGAFQNRFRVYGRAGEPCLGCGEALVATRIAGRTSTFCPRCQRL